MIEGPNKHLKSESLAIPNALHSEHLRDSVRPIMVAILSEDTLGDSYTLIRQIRGQGVFVNYDGDPRELRVNNMINAGEMTYVISDISARDKWSKRYWNCTGIAAVGVDKETGQEVSFMSHQDPWTFLVGEKYEKEFKDDLKKQLGEISVLVETGTLDVVVFGGKYENDKQGEYLDSIAVITGICHESLGFDPVVLTGPSVNPHYPTEVYFDTQNRRLFLVRPDQVDSSFNESYTASSIDEQQKKWNSFMK